MTVVMVAILISLGVWQVHRLAWKERILARIAAAEVAPPVPLPPHPGRFIKVAVTGRFRPDLAVHFADVVRDLLQAIHPHLLRAVRAAKRATVGKHRDMRSGSLPTQER